MKTSDFNFDLPEELIAQKPSGIRGNDKLMFLDKSTGKVFHYAMKDLVDLVEPGTLMVFNNSKVRRSRCYGIKTDTGREQEFMFLNQTSPEGNVWNTMVKGAKKVKPGNVYKFPDGSEGKIVSDSKNDGTEFRFIEFPFRLTEVWFEKNGHIAALIGKSSQRVSNAKAIINKKLFGSTDARSLLRYLYGTK